MLNLIAGKGVDFLINLIAGVVGIVIVLVLERQRRPQLSMKIGEVAGLPANDPLGRKHCRWPVIEVHNRRIPRWLSWVYDGDPALACRAWISFHNPVDGGRIFAQEMPARWNEADQPRVVPFPGSDGKVFTVLQGIQYAIDIPTGESVGIAPVYRAKDSESCYGWNNESYLHNFEHPAWKLDKGRYIVRVRVVAGGREFIDAFRVVNDAPFEDFRIEPVGEEVKARVQ